MTIPVERLGNGSLFRAETGVGWRAADVEHLLTVLTVRFPHNLRPALHGDTLAVVAGVPPADGIEERRAARLCELMRAAVEALRAEPRLPLDEEPPPEARSAVVDMVSWIAAAKGWKPVDGRAGELRFAIPGEPDLPPLLVSPSDLVIERALPLLPARRASRAVRWATAHGALRLNGILLFARVAVRDPAALGLAVENRLPGDGEEDEVDCALEGVRHGARRAMAMLECLRNDAVAVEYAAANDLPVPETDREPGEEVDDANRRAW